MSEQTTTAYPPPSNAVMNALRTPAAYGLLAAQLLFVLFILEIPYWLADRFLSRHRGDTFYRAQKQVARWFFRLYPFGGQRRINVRKDAFPVPCVIVCNHQSMLDILMALLLPVNARWFIKPWTLKIPLMGELNKLAGHIRVDDTEAGDPERPQGFETALKYLQDGISILFFPEGSRSPDGNIKRFKNGAFLLAIEAGVPIVPVVLEGTGACVRKGSPAVHHPDVVMKVLPPVPTASLKGEMDAARLKSAVHESMAAEIAKLRAAKTGVPRVHGWVTRLGMFGVALVIGLLVSLSIYVKNFCIAEPPAFDGDRSLAKEDIREATLDDRMVTRVGHNWRRRRDGVNEIALSGTAWERGYANARLTPELLEQQERHLLSTAREFLPNSAAFWLVKQLIAVNNRNLPDHVSEQEQLEVLGLVEGSTDHYPDEGVPLYHRVLNYHAAHDISHVLIDNPLVAEKEIVGCTAFAAWGDATAGGDLWVARNFDWEAGEIFDKEKCILYVWPEGGLAYVHVAWAGMAGAVTGMNEAGISIHINAARTDETGFGRIGTPVSMLVKRVLEQARTIEDAHRILREAQVFVSDSYMVASRDEKRAVVIEKSPDHCVLREASTPGMLLQSNHFLGEPWQGDPVQKDQIERATTLYRWQRLEELTARHHGKVNKDVCLQILRDRKGRGDKEIGFGNRNAIDGGICAHSVIMNVSTGQMWVSSGPHTYGHYVYVPVYEMLNAQPQGALRMHIARQDYLPRDPRSTEADDLREFTKQLKVTRLNLEAEDLAALEANLRTLHNLNPDAFETAYFGGRFSFLKGKYAEAAKHFQTALNRDPHYEEVREHIKVWLNRANDKAAK